MDIVWGNFSLLHIISIIVVVIMTLVLYFILKNKNEKVQRYTLFILSLWGIAAILYNLLEWNTPLEYLPLHMCSINALLLPIAIITNNKFLNNLLPVYSFGALMAIIFNNGIADAKIFSFVFLMYYVPHMFEFIVPLLQIILKRTKFEIKYIKWSMLFTLILYTCVHFINMFLNNYFVDSNITNYLGNIVQVNYMYSISPEGLPILQNLWNIIPHPYYYLLPFIILLIFIYGLLNINNFRKKKRQVK